MQKPTLFGYGLTTKAIAKKLGGGCIFFDDNCSETYTDENNNTIKPSKLFNPNESQLEVTTPSLKLPTCKITETVSITKISPIRISKISLFPSIAI